MEIATPATMQLWSWMLVMSLAVAAVRARPEGGPVPLQAETVEVAQDVVVVKDELHQVGEQPQKDERTPLQAEEVKADVEQVKPEPVSQEESPKKEKEDEKEPDTNRGPFEPGFLVPDDSKVFPEGGSLRSPVPEAAPAPQTIPEVPVQAAEVAKEGTKEEEKTRVSRASSYLPAEARGADNDGIELNLSPGTLLVPYYGGAKGQYLIVAKPITAAELKKNKKPTRPPGNKEEEEEEEENVGEETNEEKPTPPDNSDTVTIVQPPASASMAEAKPIGIAVAGEGGVASSRPTATALVGPGGLAVARPIATAIAGIQGAELLVAGQPTPTAYFVPFGSPLGAHGTPLGPQMVYAMQHPSFVQQPLHSLHTVHNQWMAYPPPAPYPYHF